MYKLIEEKSFAYELLSKSEGGIDGLLRLESRIQRFIELRLGNGNFLSDLNSPMKTKFYARLWEVNLGLKLVDSGFNLNPSEEGAPDFVFKHNGKRVFVEAVSCTPTEGIANTFSANTGGIVAYTYPHNELLIRVMSALDGKVKKIAKYIDVGRVGADEVCIVAIDTRQLDWAYFNGISQLPAVIEAVYPVGPVEVFIDTITGKVSGHEQTFRGGVVKVGPGRSATIDNDYFMSQRASMISAVLQASSYFDGMSMCTLVHNACATTNAPLGLFDSCSEYTGSIVDDVLTLKYLRSGDG